MLATSKKKLNIIKIYNDMTYKYNGHLVDVFVSLFGFVAYLDNDLEPLDISEAEYIDVITKGAAV